MPVTEHWVRWRLQDARWVATARERLQSLSWFMKCLKEPLSRLANRQDGTRGTFFEGRFKSVAVCDEEALLALSDYIDLNLVVAKVAKTLENKQFYIDQAARGACRSSGEDRRTESGRTWQRSRLARGGRSGRGAMALPDRGPPRAGFGA